MGNDQPARPNPRQEFIQVIDITILVGIDKHKIDRFFQFCNFHVSIAFDNSNQMINACTLEILASLFSTLSVDLVGRECPAGGLKGKSKPDARLTVGGSELDYMFGVDRFS